MNVLIFCAKGFEMMEFSVFIDVMGWARNDYQYPVEVNTCGFTKQVVSTFGVPIMVDRLIDEVRVDDYDALAIPGGFEEFGFYDEAYDTKTQGLIREFNRQKKPIATICVAALALGKSGILQGRRATTYHLRNGYRQKMLSQFGAKVINERIVIDDNVITSYCPETAADVAFELLGKLCGTDKMPVVKSAMGYEDNQNLKGWFQEFSKGLDCLNEEECGRLFRPCAALCAKDALKYLYSDLFHECAGKLDTFFGRLHEVRGVDGRVVESGNVYEIDFLECNCNVHTEGKVDSVNLCECSRQSLICELKTLMSNRVFRVEKMSTILAGDPCCRFRITECTAE